MDEAWVRVDVAEASTVAVKYDSVEMSRGWRWWWRRSAPTPVTTTTTPEVTASEYQQQQQHSSRRKNATENSIGIGIGIIMTATI